VAERDQGWKAIGCSCCAGVLIVGFLCAVACIAFTRWLIEQSIESEVEDYIRAVELADIDEGTREELLDQLERIRMRALRGDVGLLSWERHDDSLDELVEDGTLTDLEAAAFGRELDRLENELDGVESTPPPELESADPARPLVRARQAEEARLALQACSVPSFRIPT
jgi:hypothetical protein